MILLCGTRFSDTGLTAMVRRRDLLRPCFSSHTQSKPFPPTGSYPNCPTTVLNWAHGLLTLEPNGSIVLTPVGDGYQRIEDPCAARSDFTEVYNDTELYIQWQIITDPVLGPELTMYQFDGSPYPPLRLLSATPNMLPTQRLRNPPTPSTTILKRSTTNFAPPIHWWNVAATTTIGAMLASVFLV